MRALRLQPTDATPTVRASPCNELMYSNKHSGAIPSELGMLTAYTLYFTLMDTGLTGKIPTQLGQLTALTNQFVSN